MLKPLVEDDDMGIIREGAITRGMRRQQVEDYDEETAPKQARLRDVSEHHLYRERTVVSNKTEPSQQVALVHNATVVSVVKHAVEILKFHNGEGAYFNSLNDEQKENIRQQITDLEIGKYSI